MYSKVYIPFLIFIVCKLCYCIKWSQHLTDYIQKDAKVNQVIILRGENEISGTSNVNDAMSDIASRFPVAMFDFLSEPDVEFAKLNVNDPQEAIFIIVTNDGKFSSLRKPFNLVSNLKPNRSRPKILIIFSRPITQKRCDNLLRKMWAYDFLDATVASIHTPNGRMNHSISKESERIRLYSFNPHTNHTRSKKFSSKVQWFPDKTKNLHGYKMTVGIIFHHPEVFVEINERGNRKFTGSGVHKAKALSEAMNFRLKMNYNDKWGHLSCKNVSNSTGIYNNLMSRKYHFFAVELHSFMSCDKYIFEWSAGVTKSHICLVVPILTKDVYKLSDHCKIINLFCLMSLPVIIWLYLQIDPNESRELKFIYMIQIILGSQIPREPTKLQEKIVFLLMLVLCTLFSSGIYTVLTDVGLHKTTTYSLESIDDVLTSNLDIEMNINYVRLLEAFSTPKIRNLTNRAIKVERRVPKCLDQLIEKRNVICTGFSWNVKYLLRNANDKCLLPKVKILDNEYLTHSISQTAMAPRSPYVKKFDTVLQKFMQFGIADKWKSPYEKKMAKKAITGLHCFNRSEESHKILRQMFVILIFGYLISILVFFAEMFLLYRLKFLASRFKIAKLLREQ